MQRLLAFCVGNPFSQGGNKVATSAKVGGLSLAVLIVAAILFGQAIALGLNAAGLPAWAAFLIVATVMAGLGYLGIKRVTNVE